MLAIPESQSGGNSTLSLVALLVLVAFGKKTVTVFSMLGLLANACMLVAMAGFPPTGPLSALLLAFVSTPGALLAGSIRFCFVGSVRLVIRMAFLLPSTFAMRFYASALYYSH